MREDESGKGSFFVGGEWKLRLRGCDRVLGWCRDDLQIG